MNAITKTEAAQLDAPLVSFTLDGREVQARASETLIEVCDREGIEVPRLCYKPGMEAVGNCRSCMVEIAGEDRKSVV
jgi:formate dehydrogenase major subunit